MRLWTIHPRYLDVRGLVALWREALLAQKVLQGQTQGYRHHPQLFRFQTQHRPVAAIANYLRTIHDEATRRNYHFDRQKIAPLRFHEKITETTGQVQYEWQHLRRKLKQRSPQTFAQLQNVSTPEVHPLFRIVTGTVRDWERVIKD